MPAITVKLNRENAVQVCELIKLMKGEGNYKAARDQFLRAILKVWPEITDAEKITPPETVREAELNAKQQRAMAEGFLHLCSEPNRPGAEFIAFRETATLLSVWPWVEFYLAKKPVEDYDFALPGEPPLSAEASTVPEDKSAG